VVAEVFWESPVESTGMSERIAACADAKREMLRSMASARSSDSSRSPPFAGRDRWNLLGSPGCQTERVSQPRVPGEPTDSPVDPSQWWIGLSGWILQDGNYTDFRTGERRQFALEFGYNRRQRLRRVPAIAEPHARYARRGTEYEVVGQLLQTAETWGEDPFVFDFGLRAYSSDLLVGDGEAPQEGDWLSGEVSLHVDPFFYMNEFAQRPGAMPLIYTWTVEEIQLSTTPLIEVSYGHPLYVGPDEGPDRVPDTDRESWRTVEKTRTWPDSGAYRLRCTLESIEPTSSMVASGADSPYGPLPG
jgi:hypothetical protein